MFCLGVFCFFGSWRAGEVGFGRILLWIGSGSED